LKWLLRFAPIALAVVFLTGCSGTASRIGDGTGASIYNAEGWEHSYKAGYTDSKGHYAGGSEMLQLAGHKGKLYAANSYWMDPRNIWYGGTDESTAWAQILRLDKPGGKWEVDLEQGPHHLRPEIIKSVTFTTDGDGNKLKEPVNLLVASSYRWRQGVFDITVFVRDDETGQWERITLVKGTGVAGENNSVRAIGMHRDKVTGVDRIFLPVGVLGMYSGVYDPTVPGKIRWDSKSESGPVDTRPLAVIEANGSLLFTSGAYIYERTDGPSPSYSVILDGAEITGEKVQSAVGGVRGLTAIPNPKGPGDSLLFVWSASSQTPGCIYRLDPDGKGGYARTEEVCLRELISEYLSGNPVYYVGAAFNDMLPVVDPDTGDTVYLIGINAWIGGVDFPIWTGKPIGGFYAGAMYAIRDKNGNYWLNEVNGPHDGIKPPLVAVRAYSRSPFKNEEQKAVYFAGFVGDYGPSPNTSWVFRSTTANALRKDAPRPKKLSPELKKAQLAQMQKAYYFHHAVEPEFTVQIPGDFVKGNLTGRNVFNAARAFNSLSVSVSKLDDGADLSQAAESLVDALKEIGKGPVTLEQETKTELEDGTPAVEVLIKWRTRSNLSQTTQAQIVHKDGYVVTIGTHTEQGQLPNRDFFKTLSFGSKPLDVKAVTFKPYQYEHKEEPVFSMTIPGDFKQQPKQGGNVFYARAANSTLSVSVGKLGEDADLNQAAEGYRVALENVGSGKTDLVELGLSKLPDGTPISEFVIKWETKQKVKLTTQGMTAFVKGYSISIGTHTWQGDLPSREIHRSIKFE